MISYVLFEGRPATTRGRWINPLILGLFGMIDALPQLKKADRPVFILGTGRSGTTLLGRILSTHPDIGFLNEPKLLWHKVHDGEDVSGSYSLLPGRFTLGHEDATETRRILIHKLHGAYLLLSGSNRVLDKYPELVFREPFVTALFPDAKFIFMSRDGWDTCASVATWSSRFGVVENGQKSDWWGLGGRKWKLIVDELVPCHPDLAPHQAAIAALTSQHEMAVVEWIIAMQKGLSLLGTCGGQIMHLNYEDLCAAPANWVEMVSEFVGLQHHPRPAIYASKVLHQSRRTEVISLPDFLKGPFNATQEALGYDHSRWAK